MALQFPDDRENGAEYTDPSNGVTYYYNENKNTWTAAGTNITGGTGMASIQYVDDSIAAAVATLNSRIDGLETRIEALEP